MARNYIFLVIICLNWVHFDTLGQGSTCTDLVIPTSIAPSCGKSNGIIRLSTKMVKPKFLWSDGNTDSIRINLAAGSYSVTIRDSLGCTATFNYNFRNSPSLIEANFNITHLNGLLKFEGSNAANSESFWNFGDGSQDIGTLSYHKFDSVGIYNITYTLKQPCGETNITKTINTANLQKLNYSEFSFKNLPVDFIGTPENTFCKCGDKSFVRSHLLNGGNDYRLYIFDKNNDTPALSPIIGGYSSFDWEVGSSNKFICYKGSYYFSGKNNFGRYVLYRTDGTEEGTITLTHSNPSLANDPYSFFIQNDTLFFKGHYITSGVIGGDYFFKTDGHTVSSVFTKGYSQISLFKKGFVSVSGYDEKQQLNFHEDINKSPNVLFASSSFSSNSKIVILGAVNNYILFLGYTPTNGTELWRTDGTVQGTQLIKDINLGTNGITISNYFIREGLLLFTVAPVNSYTYNLWRSDGTTEGTYMLTETGTSKNITSSSSFISFNSKIYFIGSIDGTTYLCKTSGTLQETLREKDPTTGKFIFASKGPNNQNELVTDSLNLYYINDYNDFYAVTCRTNGNGKFETIDKTKDCVSPGIFFRDGNNRLYTIIYGSYPSPTKLRVIKDYIVTPMDDVAGFYGDTIIAKYKGNLQVRWFNSDKSMCDTLPSKRGNEFSFRNFLPLSTSAFRYTVENSEGAKSLKANLKIHNIPNPISINSIQKCDGFLKIHYKSTKPFSQYNKFLITFYKGNTALNKVEAEILQNNQLSVALNPSANQFRIETTVPYQDANLFGITTINNSYKAELFASKNEIALGDSLKITALFYGTPPFHLQFEGNKHENIRSNLFEIYVKPTQNRTYNLTNFGGACGFGDSYSLRSTIFVTPPCLQSYNHSTLIEPMNYKASSVIKSNGKISPTTMTSYQSNSIELLPGFLADKGTIFQAKTGGCK